MPGYPAIPMPSYQQPPMQPIQYNVMPMQQATWTQYPNVEELDDLDDLDNDNSFNVPQALPNVPPMGQPYPGTQMPPMQMPPGYWESAERTANVW
ncbi:hypothetical protein KHA80_04700 [Anaerobacillus sp. HL2]|nr:hypothetical protein KHA80_04700 [Anaerobacillus sp. HL2]